MRRAIQALVSELDEGRFTAALDIPRWYAQYTVSR
jgi:hypothetical protein